MRKRLHHKPIFHTHNEGSEKKVSWLELFYDLIYVAAFIQLGDSFSEKISLHSFFKSAGIFVALWISWTGFTYYANRFSVDDMLHRAIVFIKMFSIGAMAISIPSLFDGNFTVFTISYSVSMLLVGLLHFRSYIQEEFARDYSFFWGIIFLVSGIVWLVSLFFDGGAYIVWGVGSGLVILSPMSRSAKKLEAKYAIDTEHMSERFGLLTIIVLGESFVKVLTELSGNNAGISQIIQASFALLLTCSIWWIYFDDVASSELRKTKNAMVVWLLTHIPLQFSVILIGVGIKKVVTVPMDSVVRFKYAILLGGAIGTALISTGIIDLVTYRKNSEVNESLRVGTRIITGVLIILISLVSSSMINIWFVAACLFVCLFQIVFDLFFAPFDMAEEHESRSFQELSTQSSLDEAKPSPVSDLEPLRIGLPSSLKKNLYVSFIDASWAQLFTSLFFIYILSNVLFAGLYLLTPGSIGGGVYNSFVDAFFFSVQTMSTIGFGALAPTGTYGNLIVTVEAAFGLVGVALVTGLIFARISKPSAKVLFSRNMINSPYDGKNSLSFRISNTRGNDIVQASLSLSLLVDEITKEGEHLRRIKELKLVRSQTPFFRLSWLVTHIIDEESPLFGLDLENSDKMMTFMASLSGHDQTYSNTVFSQYNYDRSDICVGRYFEDIMSQMEDGRMVIDYTKFHSMKPV